MRAPFLEFFAMVSAHLACTKSSAWKHAKSILQSKPIYITHQNSSMAMPLRETKHNSFNSFQCFLSHTLGQSHSSALCSEIDALPRALGHIASRISHQNGSVLLKQLGQTFWQIMHLFALAARFQTPSFPCASSQIDSYSQAFCNLGWVPKRTLTCSRVFRTFEQYESYCDPSGMLSLTRQGRGCSGIGCASTRMISPPSMRTAARSRMPCWYF